MLLLVPPLAPPFAPEAFLSSDRLGQCWACRTACRMILVRTCKMPLGWGTPLQLRDRCSAHRRSATSYATSASAQGTVSRGRAARRGGWWNSCCSCDAQQRLQQRVGTAHGGWSDEEEVKKVSQIKAHTVRQLESEYKKKRLAKKHKQEGGGKSRLLVGFGLSSPQGFSILRFPELGKRIILALFAQAVKLYDAQFDEIGQWAASLTNKSEGELKPLFRTSCSMQTNVQRTL